MEFDRISRVVIVADADAPYPVGLMVSEGQDWIIVHFLAAPEGKTYMRFRREAVTTTPRHSVQGLAALLANRLERPKLVESICMVCEERRHVVSVLKALDAERLLRHEFWERWIETVRALIRRLREGPFPTREGADALEVIAADENIAWFIRLLAAQSTAVPPKLALQVLQAHGTMEQIRESRVGDQLRAKIVGELIEERARHGDQDSIVTMYGEATSDDLSDLLWFVAEGNGRRALQRLRERALASEGVRREPEIAPDDLPPHPGGGD